MVDYAAMRLAQLAEEPSTLTDDTGEALVFVKASVLGVWTPEQAREMAGHLLRSFNACRDALAVLDGPAAGTAGAFGTARCLLYAAVHGEG